MSSASLLWLLSLFEHPARRAVSVCRPAVAVLRRSHSHSAQSNSRWRKLDLGLRVKRTRAMSQTRSASSTTTEKNPSAEPRPSSSILLLSPSNQVLLLHRVKTSTSFAAAHVFPGGNLDAFHDGQIPAPDSRERHVDGRAYRLGAIRECFEETGILLATRKAVVDDDTALLGVSSAERDVARKQIHANEARFEDWVDHVGGVPDLDRLIPFTRWVTPLNVRNLKRFTTQMYLYMIPGAASASSTAAVAAQQQEIIVPTPDGGVEHTAAKFDDAAAWLAKADAGEIILFPPQYFLLYLVARFCGGLASRSPSPAGDDGALFAEERRQLLAFLRETPTSQSDTGAQHPTSAIPWSEKVISPHNLMIRKSDKRAVLGLDKPGPDLQGSTRGGDWERVVLVNFTKEGPRHVEVREREEVLAEEKKSSEPEDRDHVRTKI